MDNTTVSDICRMAIIFNSSALTSVFDICRMAELFRIILKIDLLISAIYDIMNHVVKKNRWSSGT